MNIDLHLSKKSRFFKSLKNIHIRISFFRMDTCEHQIISFMKNLIEYLHSLSLVLPYHDNI